MEAQVFSIAGNDKVAPGGHVNGDVFFDASDDFEIERNGTHEDAFLGIESEASGPFDCLS